VVRVYGLSTLAHPVPTDDPRALTRLSLGWPPWMAPWRHVHASAPLAPDHRGWTTWTVGMWFVSLIGGLVIMMT
jgi:uncharacterized membrane protein YozB (DUF420 family)